ncbi:PTS glucose transporter subunit IIA [Pectinatus haikarae]|nr:PTS glucose transporter subunit IIA [Pectinatus haikarae]
MLINAPVKGRLLPLENVRDETFSVGKMGRGFAVQPSADELYAPFDGIVETVFPTRHVMIIRSAGGALVLIHIGINTAQLRGNGFATYCAQGQHVKRGELLGRFSREEIRKAGYDDTVMVTITNDNEKLRLEMLKTEGTVEQDSPVLNLK